MPIKRIIRHAHSYPGGGYGSYGGYDISLLELQNRITAFKTICLPRRSFDDIMTPSSLAGYGRYLRGGNTCQTNEFGRFKGGEGVIREFHSNLKWPKKAHISYIHSLIKKNLLILTFLPLSFTTARVRGELLAGAGDLPEIRSAIISTKTTGRACRKFPMIRTRS